MKYKSFYDSAFKSQLFQDLDRIQNIDDEIVFLRIKRNLLARDFNHKYRDLIDYSIDLES